MNKEGAFKKILPRYIDNMNITYLDENQCRKLIYGLKEINRIAYKQIIFKRLEFNQENGKHELLLNTDRNFKQIYGDIKIVYSKIDNNIIIENIEPSRVLIEYHKKRKNTYKGIPFVDQKDIFKINLIREMKK